MRATSQRRRVFSNHGKPRPIADRKSVDTTPGPLAYDGEDAVLCPECGVGLLPAADPRTQGWIRRHARFGWKPSPNKGRPLCRGAMPEVLDGPEELDVWSGRQARDRRLVTKGLIQDRYRMRPHELARLINSQPGFPKPVARLDGSRQLLYPGDRVLQFMRHLISDAEGGEDDE